MAIYYHVEIWGAPNFTPKSGARALQQLFVSYHKLGRMISGCFWDMDGSILEVAKVIKSRVTAQG